MDVTPFADVNSVLTTLQDCIRQHLGANLAGLYLHGSLATGDFEPGISDIDLLAAIASDLSTGEFAALKRMHENIPCEVPAWKDRIEVAYAAVGALRTFRTEEREIAITSPGEPFHRKRMDSGYLMNWYVVREHGIALLGPPADTIIPPIAKEEFVQTVRDYVSWLAGRLPGGSDPGYRAYAVLAACRALYLHRTGALASKKHAATWAQGSLPEWSGLIRRALAVRRERREHGVGQADTLRFIHLVSDRIRASGKG